MDFKVFGRNFSSLYAEITIEILIYIVGVLLDDLAQPSHCKRPQRIEAIWHLLDVQKKLQNTLTHLESLSRFP